MGKILVSVVAVLLVCCGIFLAGCESDAQTGALLGAGAGALAGQAIGHDTQSTVIGTAVGAGGGYVVGNEMDKKKTQAQVNAAAAAQDTVTVWITNSNGSKVSVVLRKSGPNYIGPRGELYPTMPTEDQLKTVYGF